MNITDDDRSAAAPATVSGATRARYGEVNVRNRGRLPHWERECGCYFVTFRLADSLPQYVARKIAAQNRHPDSSLIPDATAKPKITAREFESYLDAGTGSCTLRDARIAGLLAETLQLWHGKRYRLLAWCIMPNHVHVVFKLLPGYRLAEVISSWKSFTAKAANQVLGRKGKFWQREYYDRLIRNGNEFDRAVDYVMNNPVKAGLRGWEWVDVADGV